MSGCRRTRAGLSLKATCKIFLTVCLRVWWQGKVRTGTHCSIETDENVVSADETDTTENQLFNAPPDFSILDFFINQNQAQETQSTEGTLDFGVVAGWNDAFNLEDFRFQ